MDHEKRNFPPIHAEMQSCADTEWKMEWVWLPVPLKGCGYHGNGEEKCEYESIQEVCPVVQRTGLGSLCLGERGGIPIMYVGAVMM